LATNGMVLKQSTNKNRGLKMDYIEIMKVIILGIVEGITEWLPISSTGHMILVDEILKLNVTDAFKELFLVVIQLGAIMAVVVLYFKRLLPIVWQPKPHIDQATLVMWLKIALACVPAAVVGILWDDVFNALFYNYQTVAIMLVLFGILFIVIENRNRDKKPSVNSIGEITYRMAMIIGFFQLIAAVFPGTSRSGATIVGAILIGISRTVAAEFTFFLAVPVMFGASFIKLIKFGIVFTNFEMMLLIIGMLVSFVVSIVSIKFLMGYIKKHDFKAFGWYRIVLGTTVFAWFLLQS
jgi:undecaprenyl-diphosphatase